jgi:hypothetical protein
MVHPGEPSGKPPIYCYERKVQNHSPSVVTDVYWPLAGYQRNLLPPGLKCCCAVTSIPGLIQSEAAKGPLYYGPGRSTQYPTTIYAPKDGWIKATTQQSPMQADRPSLNATIEVPIQTHQGEFIVSTITISSSVSKLGEEYMYTYDVYNSGKETLYIRFSNIRPYEEANDDKSFSKFLLPINIYTNPESGQSHNAAGGTSKKMPKVFYVDVVVFSSKENDIKNISEDAMYIYGAESMEHPNPNSLSEPATLPSRR